MNRLRKVFDVLKEAVSKWSEDNAMQLGGALAFYTILSLAPLVLIIVVLTDFFVGGQTVATRVHLVQQAEELIGPGGAEMIETVLENTNQPGEGNFFATVFGVVGLIFGATGVFVQLQAALNAIWNVRPDPERGFWNMVTTRLLSFSMILVIGFLLLVSLVISAAISLLEAEVIEYLPASTILMQSLDLVISFFVFGLLFAFIFKYLPDVEINWSDVAVGAVVTSLLFVIGKILLGIYIGNSDMASAYGAAGSLVVLLVWVYYSALVFFYGAEITQVYASRYGTRILPSEHAVRLHQHLGPITEEDTVTIETPPPQRTAIWKRALPLGLLAFIIGRWTK